MSVEGALCSRLGTIAAVTDWLGVGNDIRVYPMIIPQGAVYPAATYQVISEVYAHNLKSSARLVRRRIQFTAWSPRRADAVEIARQIGEALDRQHFVADGTTVTGIEKAGGGDIAEESPSVESQRLFGRRIDLLVTAWEET